MLINNNLKKILYLSFHSPLNTGFSKNGQSEILSNEGAYKKNGVKEF